MASIGSVWGPPGHPYVKRVLAVAAYGGVAVDTPEYAHFEDNKKPTFQGKFPYGKIPAFEGKDGYFLTETSAIAKYIARQSSKSAQLLGATSEEQGLVDQWISFAASELHGNVAPIFRMVRNMLPFFKPLHTMSTEALTRAMKALDTHLASRTFLVGERITVADILVAGAMQLCIEYALGATERAQIPHAMRHFETVSHATEIEAIFGKTEYHEKAPSVTPAAKEKKPAEAKAKEPKAEKPKAEPKPKAEKPKEPEDDDDDDGIPKEEPKAKNPLDFLPKSTFNLEDWKRAYSNMDTRGPGGSLEWLYKNFDPEGFSIWRVDFKYNEELTQTFMSSNQIGGFFNRLEASRKYLFGSVGVLGKANDSVISGALICRGPDIKPVVEAAPDWESYEYKALDIKDEEQKKFFEAAMAWDLEIDGKAWVDGKNFK